MNPSDFPTDGVLSEMLDPFEALVCWFYVPSPRSEELGDEVEDGDGSGCVSCFVAYRERGGRTQPGGPADGEGPDEIGMNRSEDERGAAATEASRENKESQEDLDDVDMAPSDTNNEKRVGREKRPAVAAELRRQRAAVQAQAQAQARVEAARRSGPAGEWDEQDQDSDSDDNQVDASEYEPGALRMRVIMSNPGTVEQLQRATAAYLSALRTPNPVRRSGYHLAGKRGTQHAERETRNAKRRTNGKIFRCVLPRDLRPKQQLHHNPQTRRRHHE